MYLANKRPDDARRFGELVGDQIWVHGMSLEYDHIDVTLVPCDPGWY